MLSPIFKLPTKRLRKGQVSLNQLAWIVAPRNIIRGRSKQNVTVPTFYRIYFEIGNRLRCDTLYVSRRFRL